MKVDEHKHLRIILNSKLPFSAHIRAAITKSKKGIGILKFLSKYVIYHVPEGDVGSKCYLMVRLESVQYSAA